MFLEMCEILGLKIKVIIEPEPAKTKVSAKIGKVIISDDETAKLVKEREEARKIKDFKRADEIRKDLVGRGIILEDTPYGTKVVKNA
jgi:cysteinyl-tRNA synthetase